VPITANLKAYESTLKDLLRAVDDEVITSRVSEQLGEPGQARRLAAVDRLVSLADNHIAAAENVEREYFPVERPLPSQAAALMGGYWTAATSLLAALQVDPGEIDTFTPDDAHAARVALSLTFEGSAVVHSVGTDVSSLVTRANLYALDHNEVDDVVATIAEVEILGAAQSWPTPDAAIGHIVEGLVKNVDVIATTTVSRAVGGIIAQHVYEFLSQTALAATVHEVVVRVGALRQRLFHLVSKAIDLARRFVLAPLGEAGAADLETQVDNWIHSKVLALFANVQGQVARRLLGTAELSLECAEALQRAPDPHALQAQLPGVMSDFDRYGKWGKRGSRFLALVPVAVIGGLALPLVAVAVLALASFEFWTAADHLDRPTWVPFDLARGVATVLGVPPGGYPSEPAPDSITW
jgi:hypothetical protein